ncbi:carbohydrate kinase family protein [Flavobacterium sp. Sd200]|uniref:carbohydrate kinase family protein n=1 Tax=Flavobacterium sp. Sd200 TaxID=2692211 RepID=UPI00351BE120
MCFGEVLWDQFPTGKKIGGAPLNVALRLKTLGCEASMISSVGHDANGTEIISLIRRLGLDTRSISIIDNYPTGVVQVAVNERGSASYTIAYPAAWDKIELNDYTKELVANADALIFGSLVCRDEVSRQALNQLLDSDVYKVFDVNLRNPHYTTPVLETLMNKADFIKFNDEELLEISASLGSTFTTLEENIKFISEKTATNALCVTKGKHGAILLWDGQLIYSGGYPATVADTVGAGDSFLAALIAGLLKGSNPQYSLNFACATGALVAEQPGANPEISYAKVEQMIASTSSI